MHPVATHERRHRLRAGERQPPREPPEGPPGPRAKSRLAGDEAVEDEAAPLALVQLKDALDGVLGDDGVRVDEAEHFAGARGGARIACRGARTAGAPHELHTNLVGEFRDDARCRVLAPVVRHDDLDDGIREPEILSRDAGSASHTR